jgi:hypothetical protein
LCLCLIAEVWDQPALSAGLNHFRANAPIILLDQPKGRSSMAGSVGYSARNSTNRSVCFAFATLWQKHIIDWSRISTETEGS